jgi:hypothetical protein
MVTNLRRNVVIILAAVLIPLLAIAALTPGCSSYGGGRGGTVDLAVSDDAAMYLEPGEDYYGDRGTEGVMQLESGVDKKSARVSAEQFGGLDEGDFFRAEEAGSNVGVQTFGGSPAPTAPPSPASASTPSSRSSSGESMVSRVLAQAGIDEGKLDSWLMPKAYAQDHDVDERYLVRQGQCEMEVEDYKDAVTKITAIAEFHGGMVSDSQSQRYAENHVEGWITIRVPADKFHEAWQEVLEVGDVDQESVSTDDMSQQYLGYISHLKILTAKQATLEKMLEEALATQRKHGLGEGYSLLLDVQDRLFEVTEEIEGTEDMAGALADQITRSTITARLKELKEITQQIEDIKEEWDWGFGQTGVDAWKNLRNKGRYFGQGVVWFVVTGWTGLVPWAIFFFIGWWVYRRWVRPKLVAEKEPTIKDIIGSDEPPSDDTGSNEDPGGTDEG